MENVELKLGDVTVLINIEETKNVTIEVLDSSGNSIGKNEYVVSTSTEGDLPNSNTTDVDVNVEPDALGEDPIVPKVTEKATFLTIEEFLKKA